MPDPTIPELVARLRELNKYATRAPWKADSGYNGGGISTAFFHIPGHNGGATVEMIEVDALLLLELRNNLPAILDALERGTDAFARAWEEGAAAAFDAEYSGPLFGPALDEFYASNPYRGREKTPQRR